MWPLVAPQDMDITDPDCDRTTYPDLIPSSSQGSNVTRTPGGSTGHSDRHGPYSSVTLRYHLGPSWQPRPLASALSSMVLGAVDINTDPDMAHSSSAGPDDTMVPVESMALRHQYEW